MNSVFVSYVIAIYNIEISLLEKCVSSVISHMGKNDEVLIINDGSTNQDIDTICKSFAGENIHYFYQENRGISAVRNFGIKNAQGRYIAFIDGDDYLVDSYVSISNAIADKDIYLFNYEIIENGNFRLIKPHLKDDSQDEFQKRILKSILNYNDFGEYYVGVIWNKLFSREFLLRHELIFDEKIKKDEDGLFVLKCILANPSIQYIDFQCYEYFVNQNSVCHKYNPFINSMYIDALKEWEKYSEQIRKMNLLDEETLKNGFNRQIFSAIQGALHINAFNKNIKMNYVQRRKIAMETYKTFEEYFNLKKWKINKFYSKKNHIKFNLIKHKCFLLVWLYVKITGKGL